MIFDERPEEVAENMRKIALNKLEINRGMLMENIIAQLFTSNGKKLYYYYSYSRDKDDRMEIDFLIAKRGVTNRHNIAPIEVKSSTNYTHSSLNKFIKKYGNYISDPYLLHKKDLEIKDRIIYLPLYMASLL